MFVKLDTAKTKTDFGSKMEKKLSFNNFLGFQNIFYNILFRGIFPLQTEGIH